MVSTPKVGKSYKITSIYPHTVINSRTLLGEVQVEVEYVDGWISVDQFLFEEIEVFTPKMIYMDQKGTVVRYDPTKDSLWAEPNNDSERISEVDLSYPMIELSPDV